MGQWFSSMDDRLRETKQQVNRSIRELERQRLKYEREEKILIQKLKTDAKNGRMQSLRVVAKDIVRSRKVAQHCSNMKSQMNAVLMQLQSAQSANMLSNNLKNVNNLISKVSQKTNIVDFQKIIQSLGRETEIVNLKLDVMSETLDNTLQDADSMEEEEKVISQILEEIGIETWATLDAVGATPLNNLPKVTLAETQKGNRGVNGYNSAHTVSSVTEEATNLESRINNLKSQE